jgi:pimeloyl-ACP methyl ester carboxylesterase
MQQNELKLDLCYGSISAIHWVNESADHRIPILALHGWLDNASSFVPLAAHLMPLTTEIVAVDLPGHGHSDHREPGSRYHFVDYVFDVIECADQLGWDRFVLLGHSMGAGIASLIAATVPERVSQLILIDGLGPRSARVDASTIQLKKSIRMHQRIASRLNQSNYPDWDSLIEIRAAAGNINKNAAELLVRRNAKQSDGKIVWLADNRLKLISPIYMAEQQVLCFLSSIKAPTLLIRAQQGLLNQLSNTAQRLAAIKGLQLVDIKGGHHVHMENPKLVATYIGESLIIDYA